MGLVATQPIHPSAEQELAEIVEFVTRHTRSPGLPWNVADEYPHVFQAKNLSFMKRLYSESGELIALALWWPLLLQTPRLNWKLALIGSVATHPEHRRKGYSREVIGQCLSEATRQSCDLAVLWSDQSEFYTRLGFSPCGYEELFLVDRPLRADSIPRVDEREIRVGPSVDPAAILRLYQGHTIRAVRSLGDIKKFLHIPGSQVWTSWSKKMGSFWPMLLSERELTFLR
jgi:predicted N-acetyltransferase YhbS